MEYLLTMNIGLPIIQDMDIQYTLAGLRKAGLTQAQIGDAIGVRQPTVSDMEAGKSGIKRPSHSLVIELTALAGRHGVPTDPPKRRTRRPPTIPT